MRWRRDEMAWAAGLIEGEGCVTRQITSARSNRGSYWQLTVTSTDLDVLERLREVIGFGRIYEQAEAGPRRKRAWQYKVYRQNELYAVLAALFGFMCARRQGRMSEAIVEMGARGPWQMQMRRESLSEGRSSGKLGGG